MRHLPARQGPVLAVMLLVLALVLAVAVARSLPFFTHHIFGPR